MYLLITLVTHLITLLNLRVYTDLLSFGLSVSTTEKVTSQEFYRPESLPLKHSYDQLKFFFFSSLSLFVDYN